MKILLVEPDVLLGRTYADALEQAGHKVIIAPTAQRAVFAADKIKPDLVILEIQLVSHSGIEFLYEFRSYHDWKRIPVLILSQVPPGEFAGSRELLREQLGVVAYHYKPQTSLAKLLRAVKESTVIPAKAGI
jgi:DNA-binding response OmpR family regulator